MDPLTIACAIGAAIKTVSSVSQRVYTFVGDVKEVNESIQGLSQELTGVESSLQAIMSGLANPALSKANSTTNKASSSPVFQALKGSLDRCEATLDRFSHAISGLTVTSSSLKGKIVRQVRLDWSKDHITTCRSQLQTHIGALNLALQMVNLLATCLAPSLVIADLGPRIDEVITKMEQMSPTIIVHKSPDFARGSPIVPSTKSDTLDGPLAATADQVDYLKESAEILVTHARSLVARSETGSSTPTLPEHGSCFSTTDRSTSGQRLRNVNPPCDPVGCRRR